MGILLTVSYDGTNYCGWQDQRNGKSVQEALSRTIREILEIDFTMLGASRTDAGVHALGQRAHVIPHSPCKVPAHKLPLVLNAFLPEDIRITDAAHVPDSFHPINEAKSKTYRYAICNTGYQNPLLRNFSAFIPAELNVPKMTAAAGHFVGEHDFAAFCASGSIVKSTVRTVYTLDVVKRDELIEITISGNGFLYNMVRIIAGTLADAGLGKIAPDDIPAIIQSRDRTRAGKTMPPQGLTLLEVVY
jgi:tRNA pseudouridine38-40 synthase